MNAICLVIDRLHAGYLGAYGNTWVRTPHLDRLAARSFLFDQALIDSPRLDALYRSFWHGWHAIRRRDPPEDRPALADLLAGAGVKCSLLTDEPAVARHRLAAGFDELVAVDPAFEPRVAAAVEATHLARCFAQAIDWLESARPPFLLWCHFAGLGGPWDAPLDLRGDYVEEDDPPAYAGLELPSRLLDEGFDPDEVLPVSCAYAGQVAVLDACVGALSEFLAEGRLGAETLLVLAGARGLPLGEHRRLGPCDEPLYTEVVQTPWMMRFPDGLGAAARSQALVEPSDLWATLLGWWQVPASPESPTACDLGPLVRGEADAVRDRLCIVDAGLQQAIRTPAWFLRASGAADEESGIELYAKPDDRWEVNNVADRCRDVAEKLRQAFEQCGQMLQTGRLQEMPPLEEDVVIGVD